ncbi:serine hydrolase (plasmid) [Klebsiella pneumoniae]|nr:serine hydrolase [Klebsiella pneumoniae]
MEHFHNNNSVTSSSVTTEELNTARRLITRRINEHRLSVGISLALSAYSDTHFICHGNSDPLASKPTTPDTVYEIGSVSKVLTGLLLSLLSPEGLVSLDTPVRDVLPAGLIFPDTELATATLLIWQAITPDYHLYHRQSFLHCCRTRTAISMSAR